MNHGSEILPMPLQNRVTPFGDIITTPDRGMFTGNRGILHNDHQQLIKNYTLKAWITCRLNYRNIKREVMKGRKWTELFFLDEASAFAAGHRPCAFCRNEAYKLFKKIWLAENHSFFVIENESVKTIDNILHLERMTSDRKKKTHPYQLHELPDGTIFARTEEINADYRKAYLWYGKKAWLWNSFGYSKPEIPLLDEMVNALTPPSIVRCFRNGYQPVLHHSLHDY